MPYRKLFLCLFLAITSWVNAGELKLYEKANLLTRSMSKIHYAPKAIDAKFQQDFYRVLLDKIDPSGLILLKSDSLKLFQSRFVVDSAFSPQTDTIIAVLIKTYKARLASVDSLMQSYKKGPINFAEKNHIRFLNPRTKVRYAESLALLLKKRERGVKFKILFELAETYDSLYYADRPAFLTKQEEVKLKIVERELCRIKAMLNPPIGLEKSIQNTFLDAIASTFDPHSNFFSQNEKQGFQAQVSREDFSFGLFFEENAQGDIVVSHLVPGGAAWVSNKINPGDKIVAFRTEKQEKKEISCESIYALSELFFSSPEKTVELSIQKQNAELVTVTLHKDKQVLEENVLHSYVLGEKQKLGYVSLPGFYTEWNDKKVNGCANDLAKEILKLRKDSIGGLIIDLRNNGGGSMQEALSLAGIFVNEGPLCYIRSKAEKPLSLKDMNRGTIYDDPMLILINGYSASASELFAAILQDYNRALIVGSPSFGKATAQIVLPIDSTSDFMKVTIGKIYRIKGLGHQSEGVIPDIQLTNEDPMSFREKDYMCAFPNDSIKASPYFLPLNQLPISALKVNIAGKLKNTSENSTLKNIYEQEVPIQLDAFMAFYKKLEDEEKNFKPTILKTQNNTSDKALIEIDEFKKSANKEVLEEIQEDPSVAQAYQILNELILTLKK